MEQGLSVAILSEHARSQIERRGVEESEVRAVLEEPEAISRVREGRIVAQALDAGGKLLRVFVETSVDPPVIVTAYRTNKLAKYRDLK